MGLSCWICGVVAVATGFLLCSARPARAEGALAMADKVITAPWAIDRDRTRATPRPRAVPYAPPPLPTTPAPPPLSAAEQQALRATLKSEHLPEPTWLRFVVSNEWRHDVTFPRLFGLGGVHIGVATDQNYTLAAAARAELVVLFDYDLEVVRLHRVYQAFLRSCETAADFRALFDEAGVARGQEILRAAGEVPKESAQLVRVYTHYRERLQIYLRHVANLRVGERRPTWLGDPAAYAYVRALVQGGRMVAVQGDLNGTVAMRSIGEAARALKLPVRVLYTSNAEGFFAYSPAFRDNLASLPHDDKTVVLRTYKHRFPAPEGDSWHYSLQSLDDLLGRMAAPGYRSVHQVMADLRAPGGQRAVEAVGTSYYDASVPRASRSRQ